MTDAIKFSNQKRRQHVDKLLQQDGTLVHYTINSRRTTKLHSRWIGKSESIKWPLLRELILHDVTIGCGPAFIPK